MSKEEIESLEELFRHRYSSLNNELESICNLSGLSKDRKDLILSHINILLDMKSNLLITKLIDIGVIDAEKAGAIEFL